MNGFLKGFMSLFDWMSPRSLEEQMDDLDDRMQNLYDKMGWGQYKNPINNSWNTAMDINISNDIIQETYVMNKDGKVVSLTEDMENTIYDSKITMTTSKNLFRDISNER
jgi:hypothetical protein